MEFHKDRLFGVVMNYDDTPAFFQRETYFLTTSRKELFRVIHESNGYEADEEYALLCLKEMKRQNPEFYVGAYSDGDASADLLE